MSRAVGKEYRPLVKRLIAAGCELRTGGKHTKVYFEDRFIAPLPGSPGDRRSLKNTEQQIRGKGVPI